MIEIPTINPAIYRDLHCEEKVHCVPCRRDREFRRSVVSHNGGGPVDYKCTPLGLPILGPVTDEIAVPLTVGGERREAVAPTAEQVQAAQEQQRINWRDAAGRLAHGVIGLAKYHLGIDASPADLIARRLAVCDACELSQPKDQPVEARKCGKLLDAITGQGGCGCGLTKKTAVAGESCPIGKW